MKHTIIILWGLFCLSSSFGQIPTVKDQRGFEYRCAEFLDTIGIPQPNFKIVACDFRVWQSNYATGQRKFIHLQLFKEGT